MLKIESHDTQIICTVRTFINESNIETETLSAANMIIVNDPYHSLLCNFLFDDFYGGPLFS